MSLRKLVVVLVAVCLSVVIATVLVVQLSFDDHEGAGSAPADAIDPNAPAYAYITSQELVLMRGDYVLTRVTRVFDAADSHQNVVVWTHSGNYVAFLSGAGLRMDELVEEDLIFIDVQTGKQDRVPCPACTDIIAVEDNQILAQTNAIDDPRGQGFLRFDLNSSGPGERLDPEMADLLVFLTSTRDHVLATAQTDTGQALHLMQADDLSVNYSAYVNSNSYMPTATSTVGDEVSIAIALRKDPGLCAAEFPIYLLSSTPESEATDLSAAQPPGYVPGAQGGIEVNDLFWGLDDHFYATIASWTCDNAKQSENDKQILASPSSLWRLDDQKWVQVDREPATMVRQLDRNTNIVLVIPDCVGTVPHEEPAIYCNTGTLYRDHAGRRTPIAEQVISISAPPSQ